MSIASIFLQGKTYFFFSHTFKEQPYNRSLLKACLDKQITLIDWELLKKDKNRLIGFGYYAGLVGAFETLRGFGRMTKKYYLKSAKELGTLQKIKKELKWKPKTSLEKGLDTVLKNIFYWNKAPLWTKNKIKSATKNWFKYKF